MADSKSILVEIVYVPVNQNVIHQYLPLPMGASVAEALDKSGLLQSHPETKNMPVGIFGLQVPLTRIVNPGDRIEIYRPLLIDPKEKRRQRAVGSKK